jgi:CBS domain-containing protein
MTQLRCHNVVHRARPFLTVEPSLPIRELERLIEGAPDQDVFPVVGGNRTVIGVISAESLRVLATNPELRGVAIAADVMGPLAAVRLDDDLRTVTELLVSRGLRALPVVTPAGEIIAMLDEQDISMAVLDALGTRG